MSPTGPENAAASTPDPEELARAKLYGLISRLFYEPADSDLLAKISERGSEGGEENGGALAEAWRSLQEACRSAYPAIVRQEHDSLFVGVGRAAVTPYLSGYAEPSGPDRYLVRLREHLDAWQLARPGHVFEMEDHISGVCDVMRCLIEGQHALVDQRKFFDTFLLSGAIPFFDAVQQSPVAGFYKPVAQFASSFFEVERAAFDMTDLE
jgi:TorA maturation chaperone TorD